MTAELEVTMFSRRSRAERTAEQAWHHLASVMAAAGSEVRSAGRGTTDAAGDTASAVGAGAARLADRAGDRVNRVADEAWTRAQRAADALAGHRPPTPWGTLIGAGLIGVALGWAVAATTRAARDRQAESEEIEMAETAVVVTPAPHN